MDRHIVLQVPAPLAHHDHPICKSLEGACQAAAPEAALSQLQRQGAQDAGTILVHYAGMAEEAKCFGLHLRARQNISAQLLAGVRGPKELAATAAEAIEDGIDSEELLYRFLSVSTCWLRFPWPHSSPKGTTPTRLQPWTTIHVVCTAADRPGGRCDFCDTMPLLSQQYHLRVQGMISSDLPGSFCAAAVVTDSLHRGLQLMSGLPVRREGHCCVRSMVCSPW